jgi:hypothetical protein
VIDTLKASKAGFTDDQIEVLRDHDGKVVTKEYLDLRLKSELEPIRVELGHITKLIYAVLAGIIAILIKLLV